MRSGAPRQAVWFPFERAKSQWGPLIHKHEVSCHAPCPYEHPVRTDQSDRQR